LRLALCALLLAAPAAAQSTATTDVAVAAARLIVSDSTVRTLHFADTTLTRPVAAAIHAAVLRDGTVHLPKRRADDITAWVQNLRVWGDRASVEIRHESTVNGARRGAIYRLTFVRRPDAWEFVRSDMIAIS
jgi:hypothetical protein